MIDPCAAAADGEVSGIERERCHILVTGPPGVGKTTLIRTAAAALAHRRPVGFYTAEVRERGERRGFSLVSLDGRRGLLAHVDIRGRQRVGRYGVDVEGFDRFLDTIQWDRPGTGLVVIDEIGKMECFSGGFRALVRRILDSDTRLLATVARRGSGLIAEVKQRPDVEVLELTRRNRDLLAGEIVRMFA
jgi:nucleoside-triphosphatase